MGDPFLILPFKFGKFTIEKDTHANKWKLFAARVIGVARRGAYRIHRFDIIT